MSAAQAATGPVETRVRLDFLDGLRGLAALYVVMHHAWNEMGWQGRNSHLPAAVQHGMSFFMPGGFGVAIFIVLSGYCLMLPVVRSADLSLRGGSKDYLKRRAHRILPPYFAALALSLLLIALIPDLRRQTGIQTQLSMTDRHTFLPALISHLTLFHNLRQDWAYKFNSPLWSVGTEWQIYFLLPWVLLPLWRRLGVAATALAGYAIGLAPHYIFHGYYDASASWFIGLFAMGMCGAAISFSRRPFETALREKLPWGVITLASTAAVLWLCFRLPYGDNFQKLEILIGPPVMSLLIYCALFRSRAEQPRSAPLLLRMLECRVAVLLGAMSYSLYLTHILVVEIVNTLILKTGAAPLLQLAVTLPLDTALALALGYGFHLAVERRFMPGHLQRKAS